MVAHVGRDLRDIRRSHRLQKPSPGSEPLNFNQALHAEEFAILSPLLPSDLTGNLMQQLSMGNISPVGIKKYGKFWDMLEASVSIWVVGPAGGDDLVVSRSV